jgi:antitoxin component YwqK of YwqJK toxin-antitoxin module
MVKYAYLVLLIFLSVKVQSQKVLEENLTEKDVFYWDASKKKIQSNGSYYKDFYNTTIEKHGQWLYYSEDGSLEEERNYYRDFLHGKTELFYPNKQKKEEGYFNFDTQDSIYRKWNENGILLLEGYYYMGVPSGEWKEFYDDGTPKSVTLYEDTLEKLISFWIPDSVHSQTVIKGTGTKYTIYNTGDLKELVNYKDSLKHGPSFDWSISGVALVEAHYKYGILDSNWIQRYSSGQLQKTCNYSNGILDGAYATYYENGDPNTEGSYAAGQKNGFWRWHTENGTVDMEGTFENDLQHGDWKYFFETGQLSYNAHFDNGMRSGFWEYFYRGGEKYREGNYFNDLKDGLWATYYEDGTTLMLGSYLEGLEEGVWVNNWENGNLKNQSSFIKGQLNGPWYSYFENGNLHLYGEYKKNLKTGQWVDYFENGNPKDIVTYKIFRKKSKVRIINEMLEYQSLKHGRSISFSDKDFEKIEEGNFKKGEKEGAWIAYHPGGYTPAVITEYKAGILEGSMRTFDKKGRIVQFAEYKDGVRHGRFVIYDRNEDVLFEKKFAFGYEIKDNGLGSGSFKP